MEKKIEKVLLLTVGSSCNPLVVSIRKHNPDHIVFFCSGNPKDGKGSYRIIEGRRKVCGTKPNVIVQANAQKLSRRIVQLTDIDNLDKCYSAIISEIKEIQRNYPDAQIFADYTGGTKTMSAALVLAADIAGAMLSLVHGKRISMQDFQPNTERAKITLSRNALIDRQLKSVESSVEMYDYASAVRTIEQLESTVPDVPDEYDILLGNYLALCRALDEWDTFDHHEAYKTLETLSRYYETYLQQLEMVIESRSQLDKKVSEGHSENDRPPESMTGYEIVEDLYWNAERRAAQGRYDDAVARLYRMTEMAGQILLLRRHQQNTSDLNVKKLPEDIRKEYEEKAATGCKIQISLMNTFELLKKIEQPDIAKIIKENINSLKNSLEKRNNSILAHGFTPITKSDYNEVKEVQVSFVRDLLIASSEIKDFPGSQQLPNNFDLLSKNQPSGN